MPTTAVTTYSNVRLEPYMDPDDAELVNVALPASVTYAKGTVLGELTASPGTYKAYASGNADGSQVPKVILAYAATTDASGNITWGGQDFGETRLTVPAYFSGTFLTTELTGLDANAMTVLAARLVSGTVANGVVRLG